MPVFAISAKEPSRALQSLNITSKSLEKTFLVLQERQ